ncbi:MAG: AAA family ATPase [Chloroflexi bacterium]|nr:AAA family ATPase [Chloroflexota bacterium]
MIYLKSITLSERKEPEAAGFPFALGIVRSLKEIEFNSPVAFFVGENGSGKSTIMEALACAIGSITVGSESVKTDPSLASVRKLSQYFRLSWLKRTHKGFFLRAEDFFGYAKAMRKSQEQLQKEMVELEREARERSELAAAQTRMPYAGELSAIKNRYGDGLDNRSHGESFMTLFQARFVPGGLYLLDEPEAALSPSRQLSFITALKQMVEQNSQFIIATHSPIILAFPDATIWSFDGGRIHQVRYDQLEHVNLTRDFLQNPQAFLRHL